VAATGLVVAYGMLTLTPPSASELFDLTVYLDPDPALRRAWRLARDTSERGYTADEVMALAPARERDAARFVRLQRPRADVVVRFRPHGDNSAELDVELSQRHRSGDSLCAALAAAQIPGCDVAHLAGDDDERPCNRVLLDAGIAPEAAATAAALIWGTMPDLPRLPFETIGQIRDGAVVRHAPALALTQLLIVAWLVAAKREA
jgi:phosphoribulokinase